MIFGIVSSALAFWQVLRVSGLMCRMRQCESKNQNGIVGQQLILWGFEMSRKQYVQVDVVVPQCPKCQSENRTAYHNVREMHNVVIRGEHYAKMQLRRTTCTDCGQNRVERVLYQHKKKSAPRTRKVENKQTDTVESSACIANKTSKKK